MLLPLLGVEVTRVLLASTLGYLSIGCWLCAQFPQVLKNAKLKSCEGLALPFLINWLFGDITNIIGCLLTDQLPFQTYLAAYFCVIDIALVSQFFYYQPKPRVPHASPQHSLILPSSPRTTLNHTRSSSHPPNLVTRPKRREYNRYDSTTSVRDTSDSYTAIYEAALDVARAAERASGRSRSRRRRTRESESGRTTRAPSHGDVPNAMMESFHSELSNSTEMSAESPSLDGRGRSMQRSQIEGLPETRSKSRSISMIRGSSGRGRGRRAAGVAFMSFGLIGMISLGQSRSIVPRFDVFTAFMEPPHPPESPSFERIVGRISAWTCTTLYLTSRLPQIWKNFTRKSVEGLSILLFMFAFCGNTAYVISILLNPSGGSDPSEANHYLLEALPYLLGSGGTLLFDLTIMIQSLVYGSAPPITPTSSSRRRNLFRKRYRHLEDGLSSASLERQPLLQSRERSVSGEARTRVGSLSPVRPTRK